MADTIDAFDACEPEAYDVAVELVDNDVSVVEMGDYILQRTRLQEKIANHPILRRYTGRFSDATSLDYDGRFCVWVNRAPAISREVFDIRDLDRLASVGDLMDAIETLATVPHRRHRRPVLATEEPEEVSAVPDFVPARVAKKRHADVEKTAKKNREINLKIQLASAQQEKDDAVKEYAGPHFHCNVCGKTGKGGPWFLRRHMAKAHGGAA